MFDETVSENGAWNVTLSGAASTTPVGVIERYHWDFGADTFAAPLHFPYKYETEPYASVSNGVLHLAQTPSTTASGYVYAFTRDTVPRTDGLTAQTRMRARSGTQAAFGFKRPGSDCSLNAFAYSFVFSSGRIRAAYNNSRQASTSYTADVWYDLKIELKQSAGARFYVKTAEASEWTLLYETDVGTDTLFQRGWSKTAPPGCRNRQPAGHDRGRGTDLPALRTGRRSSGDPHGSQRGAATHSAVAAVTCLAMRCRWRGSRHRRHARDADAAACGQWRIVFSAANSTDDRGARGRVGLRLRRAIGFRPPASP